MTLNRNEAKNVLKAIERMPSQNITKLMLDDESEQKYPVPTYRKEVSELE